MGLVWQYGIPLIFSGSHDRGIDPWLICTRGNWLADSTTCAATVTGPCLPSTLTKKDNVAAYDELRIVQS